MPLRICNSTTLDRSNAWLSSATNTYVHCLRKSQTLPQQSSELLAIHIKVPRLRFSFESYWPSFPEFSYSFSKSTYAFGFHNILLDYFNNLSSELLKKEKKKGCLLTIVTAQNHYQSLFVLISYFLSKQAYLEIPFVTDLPAEV